MINNNVQMSAITRDVSNNIQLLIIMQDVDNNHDIDNNIQYW